MLEQRKLFSRITPRDESLLRGLHDLFEVHADNVVEQFYEHLMRFEPLRPLLADPATVERLKEQQRQYLLSLASGTYDEAYAAGRLRIGRVHEEIGLRPQWYLGTYCLFLDLLIPHVHRHYETEPRRAVQSVVALTKLLILDMQIVLDAYYETRHKKAVERSEQLAAVGELAASIAHEVRNPLAGMKGALQVLRKELSAKPATLEVVDELVAQISRMEGLVRDLLTYATPRPVSRRILDLHELVDRVLRHYKDDADAAGITIERIYGPGTARLYADPQQMEQVFINVLSNAIQAMEHGGTLTVSMRAEGRELALSFHDTGKGIPAEVLPNIFQPFFTTKHRGSGLGLAIVRKIVEDHGGTIEIRSEPGSGTTAEVQLPRGEVE